MLLCSFQSPVLKTQTITISDVSNSLRGVVVAYRDAPLCHSETKTITYESAQVRSPGEQQRSTRPVLLSVLSETNHQTKTAENK